VRGSYHNPARVRCVDGRAMRHDPQSDDPYLETDIGQCEECEGRGCHECDVCGVMVGKITLCLMYGTDAFACNKCRGDEDE
jgi:hypothetical protein